ncbi:MAG: S8 family serine peptidase, partial [Ignavibacteria bacterium]
MSKKFTLTLLLLFSSALFSGWGDKTNLSLITNYYYYKNQPFYLNLKPDALYIKFEENVTEERFRAIISEFNQIYSLSNFNEDDTKYFLQLNSSLDESAIINLMQTLKSRPEIEYCSPVFSPDDGTTLIGVEDEILVQFKPTISSSDINNYLQSKNLTIIKSLDLTGGTSYLLKVSKTDFAIDAANEIYRSGKVNWAEPNLLFTNLICYIPNDTFFTMQWALRNTGNNIPGGITGTVDCDMDLDSAWDLTLGSSAVKIAISDTGVDTLHEDLEGNMVVGSGYDFWNNDPWAWDDHNHGTACAGIVAALGNNVIGVSGVAPNCKLIPVKWLSATGNGNYAGATSATIWSY